MHAFLYTRTRERKKAEQTKDKPDILHQLHLVTRTHHVQIHEQKKIKLEFIYDSNTSYSPNWEWTIVLHSDRRVSLFYTQGS